MQRLRLADLEFLLSAWRNWDYSAVDAKLVTLEVVELMLLLHTARWLLLVGHTSMQHQVLTQHQTGSPSPCSTQTVQCKSHLTLKCSTEQDCAFCQHDPRKRREEHAKRIREQYKLIVDAWLSWKIELSRALPQPEARGSMSLFAKVKRQRPRVCRLGLSC